ncbi:short-chain dehydrogenase/reductase SDR [Prosthecochloris aestuarii DSM 271]|uniref:Short-chain dehydrogenase/reductase SDR n=2 Tax=Prosthecochloris TaxID=1101 RepID=B4S7Q0_PROA2|nr:SDR family NAD(P)-dependent oxidoreductase [Prosthecochloris aestuarii]ACF46087.1 short-chain dehydrogenase/reductase SDR [Prosthecochloris aestuarii DSM 271]
MQLSGKVALITGASGGIGSASARCFAREGASVILSDRTVESCFELEKSIREEGGEVRVISADVTREAEIKEMFAGLDRLDILLTLAGGDHEPVSDIEMMDCEKMSMNLDLNLKSCMLCCREAARLMKSQRYGRIVTMSSLVYRGSPGQFSYAAAKGGIFSFTRSLAMALGSWDITVNALAPALVDVPLFERVLGPERWKAMAEAAAARYPLRRIATAEDVARAALFFASDDAAFITGQILEISGGARL